MYKVIYKFKDLQDDNFIYQVGDVYPRKEYNPTEERIKELSTKNNKIGKILIKKIKEEKKTTKRDTKK